MITKIKIGKTIVHLNAKRGLDREHQVEELKNFITRPALFRATHA